MSSWRSARKGDGKLAVFQRVGLYLFTVFLPYFSRRINRLDHSLRGIFGVIRGDSAMPWLRKFAARWRKVESYVAVLNLLHWARFLAVGDYITIPERLLQVTSIPIDPSAMRLVQFEYMHRLMVWNGIHELLLILAPMFNLSRMWRTISRKFFPAVASSDVQDAGRTCGFCGASPMMLPQQSSCGHRFCYFCIASEKRQSSGAKPLNCPVCEAVIKDFRHV